jgi:hypothetical protein
MLSCFFWAENGDVRDSGRTAVGSHHGRRRRRYSRLIETGEAATLAEVRLLRSQVKASI